MARFISYDTSKKLWEAIKRSHYKRGDKAKIIDLIIKSYTLKQGDRDILKYSNELRDIHTELDHCYPQSTDSVTRAREDTNRLCQLLQGLRPEFEMIRSQLCNREEEPTFDIAVTKLMQEESRLQALKGEIEGNAYITKGQRNYGQTQGQYLRKSESEKLNRDNLVCNYCKRTGHTKDKCWKLHGLPPHIAKAHLAQNSQQEGSSNFGTEGIPSAQDFQRMMEELQSLKTMINSSSNVIGSTSMGNSGNNEFFSHLSLLTKDFTSAWILDSGATDHMTPLVESFSSYEKIAPGKHVQTADGTLLQVIGIGNMNIQPIGNITNVLHVPKLFVSLISVQRLAKIKEFNILFNDIDAYLCHKVHGWKIGLAKSKRSLLSPLEKFDKGSWILCSDSTNFTQEGNYEDPSKNGSSLLSSSKKIASIFISKVGVRYVYLQCMSIGEV